MSNQFSSDEEVLARLVREAGDPSVSPDPQYAQTLRSTLLDRVGPAETVANVSPIITVERTRQMKRIAKFTVAASILVALGISVFWMTIGGGSTNIAFANVADALDSLRSATFDIVSEAKGEKGQPPATSTGKGFFLAPSHHRIEATLDIPEHTMNLAGQPGEHVTIPKVSMNQIWVFDGQAAKSISLHPYSKLAVVMDMKKMREDMKKSGKSAPPDLFERVRRLVREGSNGTGEKAERLGKKEIDGREAVGFRTRIEMGDMIVWADPETAGPIRIEITGETFGNVHMVMNNFRYDVDLDRSLFSLEPPAGYATHAMEMTMPVEEDFLRTLRTIAEDSKGVFPAELGTNFSMKMEATFDVDELTHNKIEAEMNKVAAKYGGKDKLKAKYGDELPPAIRAEFMKATAPIMQEQMQEQAQERMQKQMPLAQKRMRGITFYTALNPENDAHYTGKDVKLGTPDRPIFWYKPTGADEYRVIYADLSVKDMAPDDVEKLPEATAK